MKRLLTYADWDGVPGVRERETTLDLNLFRASNDRDLIRKDEDDESHSGQATRHVTIWT